MNRTEPEGYVYVGPPDFTVGAVFVAGKMENFKGEIRRVAVFDRALTEAEMIKFR